MAIRLPDCSGFRIVAEAFRYLGLEWARQELVRFVSKDEATAIRVKRVKASLLS
jgi:hypothetical protein